MINTARLKLVDRNRKKQLSDSVSCFADLYSVVVVKLSRRDG